MEVLVCIWIKFSKHLKKEREREKRGGVHQTNTNYHLLEVLVFWGGAASKMLVLVLVCSKKGEEGIRSRVQVTGRGSQEG
jgi:hypothetical protein